MLRHENNKLRAANKKLNGSKVKFEDVKNYRREIEETFGPSEAVCHANVSWSHLSIARHSGGCVINGKEFKYFGEDDILIRSDVVKWIKKRKKQDKPKIESKTELLPGMEANDTR